MKVVVIGLGSMGKRRIRLIKMFDKKINIVGVDLNEIRCHEASKEYGIETNNDLNFVLNTGDLNSAFISTSPLTHSKIINQCLNAGCNVFTELNLVPDGYKENMALAKKNKLVLFLSSTLLYRYETKYIKKRMARLKNKQNYIYHVGQYLPDWHPWENYKSYFVADKRTNGCRELFAIELPWLIDVFGEIKKTTVVSGKMSSLDIPYKDNYFVTLQHMNGNKGMLCLDVVSRMAVRNFEAFAENVYLKWDGTPNGLWDYNPITKVNKKVSVYDDVTQLNTYSKTIIENAYYEEIKEFFQVVAGIKTAKYSFEKDEQVLKIIDGIEENANT